MHMIVGLGNPGTKHAKQRHNIGFMAVDAIFRRHSFSHWKKKFNAEIADGEINGQKVILVKPQTFMNLSGEAVGKAMRFYKIACQDIVVFYDELDLSAGMVRIKMAGGHGGHNGIKSLDAHCSKDYKRIRIGIDHPGHKERVNAHVLGDFAKADHAWLDPLLDEIGANSDMLIDGDDSSFMNKLALAIGNKPTQNQKPQKSAQKTAKGSSHIHQARNSATAKIKNAAKAANKKADTASETKSEKAGNTKMADMLSKLFTNKDK
ncbi:MAG: aminoacyl-tRNA hydrolase [Nitratireductor sp.]